MVAGSVKKINNGLTIMFKTAITAATITAAAYPFTETPGNIFAKTMTANAVNKIFNSVFIFNSFL